MWKLVAVLVAVIVIASVVPSCVALMWLWCNTSAGGGLLLSGSLMTGNPITPDGQVIHQAAHKPAPAVVVASPIPTPRPTPRPTTTPIPKANESAAVVAEVQRLQGINTCNCRQEVIISDTKPDNDNGFNPPVVVHLRRR